MFWEQITNEIAVLNKIRSSVANYDFRGKIRKSSIRNSTTYRPQNSRKSKFATEPLEEPLSGRLHHLVPGRVSDSRMASE